MKFNLNGFLLAVLVLMIALVVPGCITIDGSGIGTTTNGSITLRKVAAITGVTTTNGSLNLWVAPDLPATLDASTTNGNLDTTGITLDNATASKHSIRGDLGVPKGTLSVRTTNGNLTVHRSTPDSIPYAHPTPHAVTTAEFLIYCAGAPEGAWEELWEQPKDRCEGKSAR